MRCRKGAPAIPAGYMSALDRLYGKPAEDKPETPPQRTQPTEVLPAPHSPKREA
jgi:hypothetical protein